VTAADVQRVAKELFSNGALAATVVGPRKPDLKPERLLLEDR
jgi:predicted Zn-dependent peptidase